MRRQRRPPDPTLPTLRFNPTAWAKLLFWRDCGETEVGGFGISRGDDLLLVEDVRLVRQQCGWTHVAFDDESVADYFEQQVDEGRHPEQFARIWVHTHPGDCPLPSPTDEETFDRVFGNSTWAVMFILACGGQTYARLRFNVGPAGQLVIPVQVSYADSFPGSDREAWDADYRQNVRSNELNEPAAWNDLPDDWADPLPSSRINLSSYEGTEI